MKIHNVNDFKIMKEELNVKYSECCEMNVIENCEVDNSFSVGLMG
jgi:hypothetical protein